MNIKYKTGDWVWAFEKSIYPPTSSNYTADGCIIYAPIHHIEIARKYFHSGSGPAAKYLDMGDYVTYCVFADTEHTSIFSSSCNAPAE